MGINGIILSKKKKISFKYYLDTRNPSKITDGFYPLYVQIVFNQKNTKLKAIIDHEEEHFWRKEDLEKFLNGDYTGSYRGEAHEVLSSQKLIEEIIRYEYALKEDKHSLRGLGDRLKIYRSHIINIFEKDLFELYMLELKYFDPSLNLRRDRSFARNYYESIEAIKGSYDMSPFIERHIELYIALSLYADIIFSGKFGIEDSGMMFHWLRPGAKDSFTLYIEKLVNKDPEFHFQNIQDKGRFIFYRKLVDNFFPKKDFIDYYLFLIDNQVLKLKEKLRW